LADGVVVQERRARPEADERGGAVVAGAVAWNADGNRLRGVPRILHGERRYCRQGLVGLGREVVPDVLARGVGGRRARGVGADGVDPVAALVAEEVAGEVVRILHVLAEPVLPVLGRRIGPFRRLLAGVAL